jgi:hypothetical protein
MMRWIGLVSFILLLFPRLASAQDADAELDEGTRELALVEASSSLDDKRTHARRALGHFETAARARPSWQAASGAADAHLLLGAPALSAAWYWIASDISDYSPGYLSWQRGALDRIFQKRAAITFEFNDRPRTLRLAGVAVPVQALLRELAFDPGDYAVTATSETGGTFEGTLHVDAADVGKARSFLVTFPKTAAGEDAGEDPGPPSYPRRPNQGGFGTLQILTIVATATLATGIAVGGGYLLLGSDNPKGLDSPEGAVLISVEVALIAGGTVIAIVGD